MHRACSAQLWWCCSVPLKRRLGCIPSECLAQGHARCSLLVHAESTKTVVYNYEPMSKTTDRGQRLHGNQRAGAPDPCNPPIIVIIAAWFISARRLALSREPADDGHCNRTRVKTGLANASAVDNRDGGPFGDDNHSEDSNNQCAS